MRATPLLPLLGLLLVGCNLAPRYTRPAAPVPAAFPGAGAAAETPEVPWTSFFTAPGLQGVIRQALANNRDLRAASFNVERVQAAYRIQRGAVWPSAGVMASGDKYRLPEKLNNGTAKYVEQDSVQFGILSWEIDFFGRLRSLKDQALAQFLATEQAREAARLSLVSATAQAWLTLAADQENLRLAQGTWETQKGTFDMIKARNAAGLASDLDLRQAESQVEAARADLARLKGQVAADGNALELLAGGKVPQDLLPQGLDAAGDFKDVPAGLPSQVLLRRPDIRAAEYQLMAANANIGAARAAFFPRVSLTAGIGTLSPSVSDLFGSGTRTWSFAPQIVSPIFAGGSLIAGVDAAKAGRDMALAQYEGAIQAGFRDVADGLARRAALVEQVDAQQALVTALQKAYELSDLRYKAGLDGYLNVLVAQRSLYAAQQGLVATRLAAKVNQVALYKALAGQI
ncbi:efflux transporter outer membrane subunit [Mesoterricola sediminis]|uniref:Outer membrane protein OprM n=1 Tax=Mesoterricola sediminis TaxID=2927980 RepID=A0AA48H3Z4_9BACT|nr:efflux transporter outer membrane subunit [Mesoterricola sediminis]BDU75568.1 outer membrane protein OprM [Mesoterricola sediminis]